MDEVQDVPGSEPEKPAETTEQHVDRPAEEATAEEANEEGAQQPEQPQESEEEKKRKEHNRKNAERRLEQKRIRDLELENARLRGIEEGLKAGGKTERNADTADSLDALYSKQNPKPDPGTFETNAEYIEALTDWKLGLRDFKSEQATKRKEETESQATFMQKLEGQRAKGEEKYEDFRDVVSAVDFTSATMTAIVESERGEDVAYYLAGNPDEMARIEKLSPFLQAREVGRIEAGIESGKIAIRKTTSAPPPPKTLPGKTTPQTDESKMSDAEWFKREHQRKLDRARGIVAGRK